MGLLLGGHIYHVVSSAGTVSLSGTSGSPNLSTDIEDTPTNALAGWRFVNDGKVQRIVSDSWADFQAGVEWIDIYDANNWIRATLSSGDSPSTGPSLNTWHQLDVLRQWEWIEGSDPGGQATTSGTIKVEISSSGSGTPILATGYYKGTATQFGTL